MKHRNATLDTMNSDYAAAKLAQGISHSPIQPAAVVLVDKLQPAMAKIMPLIHKSSIEQTSQVLMIFHEGGQLELIAHNLEKQVEVIVPSKVMAAGRIAVPAEMLNSLLFYYPPEALNLGLSAEGLRLQIASHNTLLKGNDGSDFILKPKITPAENIINPIDLKTALLAVIASAGNYDSRPILQGINFEAKAGTLTMVAANGYQLSATTLKVAWPDMAFTVPAESMKTLIRQINLHLKKAVDGFEMAVSVKDKKVNFKLGETVDFTANLISGDYPDWRAAVVNKSEAKYNTSVMVNRHSLSHALRLCASRTIGNWESVDEVTLTFEQPDKITLSADNGADYTRQFNTEVEGQYHGSDTASLIMTISKLSDILSSVADESITLHFAPQAEIEPQNTLTPTSIDALPLKIQAESSTHYLMPCLWSKGRKPQ